MKVEKEYRKRILDSILERKLAGAGAVLVEGPKWCGKTTTCEQHAKSVLYMADSAYQRPDGIIVSPLSALRP